MRAVVGIDFGSTKSVVAFASEPGEPPRPLPNEFGETETPAVLAEDRNGEIVVGRRAAYRRPLGAITCAKRYLGVDKTFSLPHRGAVRAGDAVSFLLKDLKNTAERELGDEVDGATIGVPLFWNFKTLAEFRDAAARAGFNRIRLVPEPIAAVAGSYAHDDRERQRVLTYDLGGGKFEAAVVDIRDGQFTVLCGTGDGKIGGVEFDDRLATRFWERLRADGYDLPTAPDSPADDRVYSQLLQHAERSKLRLSAEARTDISAPNLGKDRAGCPIDLDVRIERHQFENMIAPDVDRMLELCRQMLDTAGIALEELDDILLLGGSSRIPLVRQRFDEAFHHEPREGQPLHCVALGAARLASREAQSSHSSITDAHCQAYVATLSQPIQIELGWGMREVVPAGVRLPFETTLEFRLSDRNRQMRVPLFQANQLIGEIRSEIPENLGPGTALELTLHIDTESQVSATIHYPVVGWQQNVQLQPQGTDNEGTEHLPDPPRETVQELVTELRQVLSRLEDHGEQQNLRHSAERALSALEEEAAQAWNNEDDRRWRGCFEQLLELRSRMHSQEMQSWDEFELLIRIAPALLHEVLLLNAGTPTSSECVVDVQQLLGDVEEVHRSALRLTRSDPEVHQTLNHAKDCVRRFQSLKQSLELRLSRPNAVGLDDMHGNVWEWCQEFGNTPNRSRVLTGSEDGTVKVWNRDEDSITSRSGSPQVPAATIDCVHFSVTAPTTVRPGAAFILDVWAHLEQQRKAVLERAQQQQGGRDILMQSKGPVSVARGTILTVRLKIDGLQVPDPEDTILWQGEIGNARFQINVPQDATPGERAGVAGIYADGLRIAKLYFSIPVTVHAGATATIPLKHDRHQRAFASYASEDRDQVLGRLQGMQKRTPSLVIFLDVLALRSGQNWEQELYREISRSDVFYLFWSNYARDSEWVDREWHCALERRGIDFIDPVPLVDPKVVPPPPELASKHFNDWVLAFLSPLNGVPPVS